MSYRRCADCARYARLSDKALCQQCDDFYVRYKVKNVSESYVWRSDDYDVFRKDFESRWNDIKRYVEFEAPAWCSVIRSQDSREGMLVLQIDEGEYKGYRRRNGFEKVADEVHEKVESILKGEDTY
jgi:hypothetical protein